MNLKQGYALKEIKSKFPVFSREIANVIQAVQNQIMNFPLPINTLKQNKTKQNKTNKQTNNNNNNNNNNKNPQRNLILYLKL